VRVLSLDASTKCGWALFVDGELAKSGALRPVFVEGFNPNDNETTRKPHYPYNTVYAARAVADLVRHLIWDQGPLDRVVIENTNKGKNRNTQRILEFIHYVLLSYFENRMDLIQYMDTSEWRRIVGLQMTKADKKNNREVSAGKKRGKITKKHMAVRMVNEKFHKTLKLKDNDEADAILMGLAFSLRSQSKS
jgi:hypothetical protein